MRALLLILLALPSLCMAELYIQVYIKDQPTNEAFKKIQNTSEYKELTKNIRSAYSRLRDGEIKEKGKTQLPKDLFMSIEFVEDYQVFGKFDVKHVTDKLSKMDFKTVPYFGNQKIISIKNSVLKEGGEKLFKTNVLDYLKRVLVTINDRYLEQHSTLNSKASIAFDEFKKTANGVREYLYNTLYGPLSEKKSLVNEDNRNSQRSLSNDSSTSCSADGQEVDHENNIGNGCNFSITQ